MVLAHLFNYQAKKQLYALKKHFSPYKKSLYGLFCIGFYFFYFLLIFKIMNVFQNKNDYSVQVYHNRTKRVFTEYVHNIYTYVKWLELKSIHWDYLLIYVRRNRDILCYYKNGDMIDQKPNYNKRGRIKQGW